MTRTVQQLQKAGYVTRVPDPDDRRAQRIELTEAGRKAVVSVRDAGARGMQMASPSGRRTNCSNWPRCSTAWSTTS